jgi:hypothetical protein
MDENTTISDKIDGIIFPLPFEDKIKCWELIEELITERIEETKVKKFSISDVRGSLPSDCYIRNKIGCHCIDECEYKKDLEGNDP